MRDKYWQIQKFTVASYLLDSHHISALDGYINTNTTKLVMKEIKMESIR